MKPTLTDKCYHSLLDSILNGKYVPGQHLTLFELKESLKSGLSPIREALTRLHSLGFLELENNKGFKVLKFTKESIRDLVHSFAHLESLLLDLSIEHGDLEWENRILAAQEQLNIIKDKDDEISIDEWIKHNADFHRALISGCRLKNLLSVRDSLYRHYEWLLRLSSKHTQSLFKGSAQEYMQLTELTLAKDRQKACLLLNFQISNSIDHIIENLIEDGVLTCTSN